MRRIIGALLAAGLFLIPQLAIPATIEDTSMLDARIMEVRTILTGVDKDIAIIDKRLDLLDTKLDDLRIIVVDNRVDIAKLDARVAIIGIVAGVGGSAITMGGKWAIVKKNGNR